MLLQLICNPFDEYQLNLSKTNSERRGPKKNSAGRYGYTPKSKYEERKGYDSDDDISGNDKENTEVCESCKPEKSLLDYAKKLFFEKSSMFINTSRHMDRHYQYNDAKNYYAPYTKDKEEQSVKLASCLLYLSRVLQPIFKNYLVYITSLQGNSESYPNMGLSEKRVVKNKLNNLLQFIKNEEGTLKSIPKESKERRGYRDNEYEQQSSEFHLNYESIIFQESQHFDFLKVFIARCIISIDFIEEISKSTEDFNKAVKKLSKEEKGHLQSIQF